MYDAIIDTNSNSKEIVTIGVLSGTGICDGRHDWNVCVECMDFGSLHV